MNDILIFTLPSTLAILSLPFFLLWACGVRAAGFWGSSYLLWSTCHFLLAASTNAVGNALVMLGLSFFVISLFLQMHGLQVWAGRPGLAFRGRLTICGAGIVLVCASTWSRDLKWLQMVVQLGTRLSLTGIALAAVWTRIDRPVGRLLFIVVAITTLSIAAGSALLITASMRPPGTISDSLRMMMQVVGNVAALGFALAALGGVMAGMIGHYRDEALRDPMTGLLNRRGFDARIAKQAPSSSGGVIMCDIDHFKAVNDSFGHEAGDRAICALAEVVRAAIPVDGVAARLGGEEFVIWMPSGTIGDLQECAEAIRDGFASWNCAGCGINRGLTVSCGIATFHSDGMSVREVMANADEALYAAKGAGRDRVTAWWPNSAHNLRAV